MPKRKAKDIVAEYQAAKIKEYEDQYPDRIGLKHVFFVIEYSEWRSTRIISFHPDLPDDKIDELAYLHAWHNPPEGLTHDDLISVRRGSNIDDLARMIESRETSN